MLPSNSTLSCHIIWRSRFWSHHLEAACPGESGYQVIALISPLKSSALLTENTEVARHPTAAVLAVGCLDQPYARAFCQKTLSEGTDCSHAQTIWLDFEFGLLCIEGLYVSNWQTSPPCATQRLLGMASNPGSIPCISKAHVARSQPHSAPPITIDKMRRNAALTLVSYMGCMYDSWGRTATHATTLVGQDNIYFQLRNPLQYAMTRPVFKSAFFSISQAYRQFSIRTECEVVTTSLSTR